MFNLKLIVEWEHGFVYTKDGEHWQDGGKKMTSFRFIHTADLHLDTPFTGLKKLPDSIFEQIKQSTFQSFDQIVELCIRYKVDFLVIAGDIFDLEDRSLRAQIFLRSRLEKLSDHGIHTYMIHGNHDPNDQVKAWMNWPEKVHIFSDQQVESVIFSKDNQELALIMGQSYPTKEFKERIVQYYQRDKEKNLFHIGILHTNVDGNKDHDSYAPSSFKELVNQEMDYWALGHIHKSTILSSQKPYIVYPGNHQGRNKKEKGTKGCYIVEVKQNQVEKMDWVETSQIIWEEIEVDISQIAHMPTLIEKIEEKIEMAIEYWKKPLILQIHLQGETELHFELTQEIKQEELREWLNGRFEKELHWVYIDQLYVETIAFGLEKWIEKGTFLGDYINELEIFLQETEILDLKKEVFEELFKNRAIKTHLPNEFVDLPEQLAKDTKNLIYQYFVREDIKR